MKDFFISYNQADRHWAEWIAWELESTGYSTVLQAWDFRPGSNFTLEMHSAAQAAERTIAVLSPDYLDSPFTLPEWAAAFAEDPVAKQGKLLPIRVRQCDPTGLLRAIVYLDLVGLDEGKARAVLLEGIRRGRQKPSTAPSFPGGAPLSTVPEFPQKPSDVRLLHLSDLWVGFTRDRLLNEEVFKRLEQALADGSSQNSSIDGVLITGDIAFSGARTEYDEAQALLLSFLSDLKVDPHKCCYIIPGNHDIDRGAIGPGDQLILDGLSTEEQIARVLSHGPTMDLLSARLGSFYDFTSNLLGKSRAWRRDRPWRVDIRRVGGLRVAFMQLNGVWSLGSQSNPSPLLGEYQVREALSEAGDCDLRVWLHHYPLSALRREEACRFGKLVAGQDTLDLVFRGTRHDSNLTIISGPQYGSIYEFAAGPVFPGPVTPSCSIVQISSDKKSAHVSVLRFDSRTQAWLADAAEPVSFAGSGEPDRGQLNERGVQALAVEGGKKPRPRKIGKIFNRSEIQTISELELRNVLKVRPVLILTAVEAELRAVLDRLKPCPRKRYILKSYIGQETYYVGRLGTTHVVVTMCGMGAIGRDSVILASQQAISEFKPKAIIMVGIAFGKTPTKQRLGDVLVASQIVSYEQQRVGEKQLVHRGTISETGPILLNRFRQALDWKFNAADGEEAHLIVGPLLSGEKLIDSAAFKQELFDAFPQAVGGEMEGAGLHAVASRFGVEWIVVKGICDWADGSKTDNAQLLAASAATSLVEHVLSESTVLDGL